MTRLSKHQRRKYQDDPDVLRAAMRRLYGHADADAVEHCVQRWLREREDQRNLRPLTIDEVIYRWGSADAVGKALLAGELRPVEGKRMLCFSWQNIQAVEARFTIRTEQAHPDRQHRRTPRRDVILHEAYKDYLLVKRRREQALYRQRTTTIDIYFIEAMSGGSGGAAKFAWAIAERKRDAA